MRDVWCSGLDFFVRSLLYESREDQKHPIWVISDLFNDITKLVDLCVCLCVCLFTFEVPFNGLFAPTSRSRMSNIFRDSESLGKSNGKKWSNIWTFLFGSGLKSPREKKFFLLLILPYKTWWKPRFHPPMALVLLSASVERCFVSRMRDFYEWSCPVCTCMSEVTLAHDVNLNPTLISGCMQPLPRPMKLVNMDNVEWQTRNPAGRCQMHLSTTLKYRE